MREPLFIYLEEATSTSAFLRNMSNVTSLENMSTVYTDYQTAGRGQKGNSWESSRGENLLFSTILYPKGLKADRSFVVSQMVSLAIKDVLEKYTSDISIKWPNDIYWKEKKITGILIENDIMGDQVEKVIIGVGINLNQEMFASDALNPVSLKQITNDFYNVQDVLMAVIERLSFYNEQSKSPETIKYQYKQSLFRKEGFHLYEDENGTFQAQIYDIEDSGLFVLRLESGEIGKYAFKEIKYLF